MNIRNFLVEYLLWVDVVYNSAHKSDQRQRGTLSLLKIAQNIVI